MKHNDICVKLVLVLSPPSPHLSKESASAIFFLMEEFTDTPFTTSALPCQIAFCQSAPLLPSATRQQHIMGYWWEGSTSTATPPSASVDVVG